MAYVRLISHELDDDGVEIPCKPFAGTPTDVQLSLASVANAAARQSAKVDLGASTSVGDHSRSVLELARILYEEMERLDPGSGGGSPWDELPKMDIEFYSLCVEKIIRCGSLVLRAMSDYDVILRHPTPPNP